MSARRGAQVGRVLDAFRRDGRAEVRFSRSMVGVYLVLGVLLLAAGLALIGMVLGVVSPGTGTVEGGDAVMGSVFALVGLFILGLGIGQARPSAPAVVVDVEGVHVLGKGIPWKVISGFGTARQGGSANSSRLVTTVLVDADTVDAWVAERKAAGGRRSRLYAPGAVDRERIALPYNLAVRAEPLSEALDAIRREVLSVSG